MFFEGKNIDLVLSVEGKILCTDPLRSVCKQRNENGQVVDEYAIIIFDRICHWSQNQFGVFAQKANNLALVHCTDYYTTQSFVIILIYGVFKNKTSCKLPFKNYGMSTHHWLE